MLMFKSLIARMFLSLAVLFIAVSFHVKTLASMKESATNVQILSTGARSLTIAFTPQNFSIKTERINGEESPCKV